ncbi:kynureninase [Flavobacteriales bacterium]|nr:kynureninase [Flavobacteriales bacterium]
MYQNTLEFAKQKDEQDELKSFRNRFHHPIINGEPTVYFTGNSLGLQPKAVKDYINVELEDWAQWGVEGHFHGRNPWFSYHELLTKKMAKVVGCKPIETVVMGSLSTNVHLLMVSFYRPEGKRTKIICEAKAFPSDQYILETQVLHHRLNPEETIIEISPRAGEELIKEEDVLKAIAETGDELALVMIGGVSYYTGQLFDMKTITAAGHAVGAKVGFDLAHAAGNINLQLHDWNVDFAAWCTYKYLNSGPGGVSGIFIHERHATNKDLVRFGGWWGQDKDTRFLMEKGFDPIPTAEGWQHSNAPIMLMAPLNASLDLFEEAGMERIGEKRDDMTAYLEFIINSIKSDKVDFEIITPTDKTKRGAQLSIAAKGQGKKLFDILTERNVIADWREPNVIRIAPTPMYNSYEDCWEFGQILSESIQ